MSQLRLAVRQGKAVCTAAQICDLCQRTIDTIVPNAQVECPKHSAGSLNRGCFRNPAGPALKTRNSTRILTWVVNMGGQQATGEDPGCAVRIAAYRSRGVVGGLQRFFVMQATGQPALKMNSDSIERAPPAPGKTLRAWQYAGMSVPRPPF